ncbi:MAG: hypothetical protein Hyperionvirus31_5 [Hyperionvirus sp.]|uniref:Uncharacterized protein n=1 Tax=Hyperionvirus sp. TaxID=2487770 RepID=A0A3G5ABM0_9VIRU|nr:MAG: hypothetical protein Hyperionvirus31_5 [Hyperionvirus sp.]
MNDAVIDKLIGDIKALISSHKSTLDKFACVDNNAGNKYDICNIVQKIQRVEEPKGGIGDLKDISDIVDYVVLNSEAIEKNFVELKKGNSFISNEKYEAGAHIIDEDIEFKSIATEFVRDNFIHSTHANKIIIEDSYEMFRGAIKLYIAKKRSIYADLDDESILFLYRGGNTLRSILKKVLVSFPERVAEEIVNVHYPSLFKRTDIDFNIVIRPTLKNFDEIYRDIQYLTLYLLNRIRNIYLIKLSEYLDWGSKDLSKMLMSLNSSATVKDAGSKYSGFEFKRVVFADSYYGDFDPNSAPPILAVDKYNKGVFNDYPGSARSDFLIGSTEAANIRIIADLHLYNGESLLPVKDRNLYPKGYEASPFFISYNEKLEFGSKVYLQAFSLLRIKLNFKAYYVKNGQVGLIYLPAEFIDVGITNKNASDTYIWDNIKESITEYSFNDKFKFLSFSFDTYITDIANLLFLVIDRPWKNPKYAKRLDRLMLLYYFDILSKVNRSEIWNKSKPLQQMFDKMKLLIIMIGKCEMVNAARIRTVFGTISTTLRIEQFLKMITDLQQRLDKKECDSPEWKTFINDVNKNIDIFVVLTDNLAKYNDSAGPIIDRGNLKTLTQYGGRRLRFKQLVR